MSALRPDKCRLYHVYRSYLSGVNQIIGSVATYLFMIRSFAICLEIAYELLVPRDLGQLLHYASITFLPNFGLRNEIIIKLT